MKRAESLSSYRDGRRRIYDTARPFRGSGTWLQLWSDTDGDGYQLEGTVIGGGLVYHGFQMNSSGSRSLIRITYTLAGGPKERNRLIP
jgi:hypothetical protein